MSEEQATVIDQPQNPADIEPGSIHAGLTQEQLDKLLQLQLADASTAVRNEAADSTDEYLRQQSSEHGVRGFLKKIWFGNLAKDYVRQRDIRRRQNEIIDEQNIYTHSDGSRIEHDTAMSAVIERVTSEYSLLHEGERNEAASEVRGGVELETHLKEVVSAFARGDIGYDDLETERQRLIATFGDGQREEDRNKGLIYADNVIEVARNARAAFEHGVGLDAIDAALNLKVAEVNLGVRTAASRELTDRIIDRVYKNPVGSLLNETVIATAVAVGMSVSKFTVKKIATAIAATVAIGVGASGIAAIREKYHLDQDKRLHDRQMAEGGQINPDDSKRRQSLEETRLRTVGASELIGRLGDVIAIGPDAQVTPESMRDLMDAIAETQTRIEISDQEGVDLISFDSKHSVEQQRLDLDIALARAKVKLRKDIEAGDYDLEAAGLEEGWADEYMTQRVDEITELIDRDWDEKYSAFRTLRRKRMLAAAAIGFAVGVTIGEASQELKSVFDDSLKGVFSGNSPQQTSTTEMAALFHHGDKVTVQNHHAATFETSSYKVGENSVDLPSGYHIVASSNGKTHELVGPNGTVVLKSVDLTDKGTLSAHDVKALEAKGFAMHVSHEAYQTTTMVSNTVNTNTSDYIAAHQNEFTTVNRNTWYANNTPYSDKNELATWWGGQNNTGIDAQGNYVLNVSHMTPGGSFEGSQAANYQQLLQNNQLGLAVSIDQGHQSQVIMLHFNADGNVIIPAGDPVLSSVFVNQGGHAAFVGAYAEVVQIGQTGPQGTDINMLGTLVGSNQVSTIRETVQSVVHNNAIHTITHLEAPKTEALPIEVTPVIPVLARSGLEDLAANPENSYGYYGGYLSTQPQESYVMGSQYIPTREQRNLRRDIAPFSQELIDDPDAEVNANTVSKKYLSALPIETKRRVGELTKQLSKEPKATNPKVVVVIPAAAHQEGKNIFQTLLQYSRQSDIDFEDLEIVAFANYPKGSRPDQTIREVRRFQKEHPGVKVRLISKQLPAKEAVIGNIRKLATDSVITDLVDRGVDLNEVIIVSNDADSNWINPKYIRTIMDRAKDNPETDAFLGFIDWSYEAYKAHPEILVSTRFMQMLEIYIRRSQNGLGSSGANFAFRPSIYMATGGYKTEADVGEDVVLGRMIKSVRAGANSRRPIAYLGRSSEINTNARRAISKLLKDGGAASQQWDEPFTSTDELRERVFDLAPMDLNDTDAVNAMISTIEKQLNTTFEMYNSNFIRGNGYKQGSALSFYDGETIRQINRMLWAIGVNVKWQPNGTFKITNSDRMIKNLKLWQGAH